MVEELRSEQMKDAKFRCGSLNGFGEFGGFPLSALKEDKMALYERAGHNFAARLHFAYLASSGKDKLLPNPMDSKQFAKMAADDAEYVSSGFNGKLNLGDNGTIWRHIGADYCVQPMRLFMSRSRIEQSDINPTQVAYYLHHHDLCNAIGTNLSKLQMNKWEQLTSMVRDIDGEDQEIILPKFDSAQCVSPFNEAHGRGMETDFVFAIVPGVLVSKCKNNEHFDFINNKCINLATAKEAVIIIYVVENPRFRRAIGSQRGIHYPICFTNGRSQFYGSALGGSLSFEDQSENTYLLNPLSSDDDETQIESIWRDSETKLHAFLMKTPDDVIMVTDDMYGCEEYWQVNYGINMTQSGNDTYFSRSIIPSIAEVRKLNYYTANIIDPPKC